MPSLPRFAHAVVTRATDDVHFVAACARRGLLAPQPPVRLARMALGVLTRGSLAGLLNAVALRFADRTAVVDELGALTYADLDRDANAIANGWLDRGLQPGAGVAILCRNHRYFLEAFFAATKCGARHHPAQHRLLRAAAARRRRARGHRPAGPRRGVRRAPRRRRPAVRAVACLDRASGAGLPLDALVGGSSPGRLPRPGVEARFTVLTSGTTGTPKGAVARGAQGRRARRCRWPARAGAVPHRPDDAGLRAVVPLARAGHDAARGHAGQHDRAEASFRRPHRARRPRRAPLRQHGRGAGHAAADAEARAAPRGPPPPVGGAGGWVPARCRPRAAAARRASDPSCHNFYGSTEVAYVSIATPAELATTPATVGRPLRGAVVRIVDADGRGCRRA